MDLLNSARLLVAMDDNTESSSVSLKTERRQIFVKRTIDLTIMNSVMLVNVQHGNMAAGQHVPRAVAKAYKDVWSFVDILMEP